MKLLLMLKLVDSIQCKAVQLWFPLQRCLDTSPREPDPQVQSTVCLCNKKPPPDSNSFKNTLESLLVVPKRESLFWLWKSCVWAKPCTATEWLIVSLGFLLLAFLMGWSAQCGSQHSPVQLALVIAWGDSEKYTRLGFYSGLSCHPSISILWAAQALFVYFQTKPICKWLTNNIYEVWSLSFKEMNKPVGICPCSFFHKVHHLIWAKPALLQLLSQPWTTWMYSATLLSRYCVVWTEANSKFP